MDMLIKGLLDYARLEVPDKPRSRINMRSVVDQVLENLGPQIAETKATITFNHLPEVAGYETQLIQLIQNLLSNGLKYQGDEPPRIHISCKKTDDEWLFGISDNGIGIAPENGEKIFEIFQRLETGQEHPGTGIGLAVCKKIIDNLGGRIWYETNKERGTTFYFTLPAAAG